MFFTFRHGIFRVATGSSCAAALAGRRTVYTICRDGTAVRSTAGSSCIAVHAGRRTVCTICWDESAVCSAAESSRAAACTGRRAVYTICRDGTAVCSTAGSSCIAVHAKNGSAPPILRNNFLIRRYWSRRISGFLTTNRHIIFQRINFI